MYKDDTMNGKNMKALRGNKKYFRLIILHSESDTYYYSCSGRRFDRVRPSKGRLGQNELWRPFEF